ncbi:MAG: SDR family NAD(P)-dependent oxidoreductase, partial [Cytophagales bacterium]|nr:SDR family NAD(P)-dependent oxidoreductase [Cytophagales bacterium]
KTMLHNRKIWFITGISSGLGQALAEAVIQSGDFVIGTFRTDEQAAAFNEKNAQNAYALRMDVTNAADIKQTFSVISQKFGRLDVLVNNAGFGMAGAIEETSLAETRELFESNFLGALQVTQAALPLMRSQKSGHIVRSLGRRNRPAGHPADDCGAGAVSDKICRKRFPPRCPND